MNFSFQNKEVTSHSDLPDNCTDIVYLLTFESGKQYIGKKTVRSIRRLKPTKKQLATRKNYVRKELVNLPFVDYEGSSTENEHETVAKKEILYLCSDKRSATYLELAELVCRDALFREDYTNKNITGKYFDNVLDGYIKGYGDA